MNIITGQTGEPHVTSQQDREINMSIFGDGDYILPIGEKLKAELITSNLIRIYDGMVCMQGCCASLDAGAHEDVTIDSLTTGTTRTDFICAKYSKDAETGAESIELVVLSSSNSSPVYPSGNKGDIRNGDLEAYAPLYRVTINSASDIAITQEIQIVNLGLSQGEKLEWYGNSTMNENESISINTSLDKIAHGLKLIFSVGHRSSPPIDFYIQVRELDKTALSLFNNKSHTFPLFGGNFSYVGVKVLLVNVTDGVIQIQGHTSNTQGGTYNGIDYYNDNYSLRAIVSY